TVVNANGTVERWVSSSNTVTVAPSCRELEAACADLLDPFALYVRAVENADVTTRHDGGTYRVTLRRSHVEETAVIDATTFLPRRIEWRRRRWRRTAFCPPRCSRSLAAASSTRTSASPPPSWPRPSSATATRRS